MHGHYVPALQRGPPSSCCSTRGTVTSTCGTVSEAPRTQPQELKPWQKRWNREWLAEAVIPDLRWQMNHRERHPEDMDGAEIKYCRDRSEELIAQMENMQPGVDKKGRSRRWRRACHRIFGSLGDLKVRYDDFKQWRQERRDEAEMWRVRAVMEDRGDNPMWKAEMVFKIQPELYGRLADSWFEFPSPDNIKWLWVTDPDGYRQLRGRAAEHWGPQKRADHCLPFRQNEGGVVQSSSYWGFWSNFPDPTIS
ncbi:hypothetical protein F4779DRAFT_641851 [Xylariaceae sp. FL0662B]|nr:hypothetical protein F4779DRAFT_641851 [Xylariaceae sp. FL0662B]